MAQPHFILNFRWKKPARLFQASTLKVEHPEIRKLRYSTLGGLRIGHSVGTGRIDRRKLDLTSPEVSSYVFRVPATADGIKAVLRRIRPREAGLLDAIDREIEEAQTRLNSLRERRNVALQAAWQHGNVVRLNEVEALMTGSAEHGDQ